MAYDYEGFKAAILRMTGIDLSSYKEKQMRRRIDTLINKHRISGYEDFISRIRSDKQLFEEFVNYLTINVSEFYRNTDQWELLDKTFIPEMLRQFGKNLKIWSAACSTGDEPYSLVMALSRHLPLNQIKILATDLDKQVIAQAKIGLYAEKSIANVPADLRSKYFKQIGASYQISNEIKSRVEFREHNLLKDHYPDRCHFIVCRNVLIYFTEEAKDEVFQKFSDALVPDGILFIGSTEQIMNHRDFGYERRNSFYYQKKHN
ncbi:MAG TPA: protein-glutamate O-methyltransferase CheR [Lachnospiraceae bacterium]|nr:protein-glutamate O-methyltransferase CheR [Lachnospiraceae bacterium]